MTDIEVVEGMTYFTLPLIPETSTSFHLFHFSDLVTNEHKAILNGLFMWKKIPQTMLKPWKTKKYKYKCLPLSIIDMDE